MLNTGSMGFCSITGQVFNSYNEKCINLYFRGIRLFYSHLQTTSSSLNENVPFLILINPHKLINISAYSYSLHYYFNTAKFELS